MAHFIDSRDRRRPTEVPRISKRYRVDVDMAWSLPSRRRVLGARSVQTPIAVIDLSIAGALLQGPTNRRVAIGMKVKAVFDGVPAVVVVRNMRPTTDPDSSYYGISFYLPSSELETAIMRALADSRARGSAGY